MATKQVLNTHVTDIVRLYGKELRDKGVQFTQLIVFGSQAKGTAKKLE